MMKIIVNQMLNLLIVVLVVIVVVIKVLRTQKIVLSNQELV